MRLREYRTSNIQEIHNDDILGGAYRTARSDSVQAQGFLNKGSSPPAISSPTWGRSVSSTPTEVNRCDRDVLPKDFLQLGKQAAQPTW